MSDRAFIYPTLIPTSSEVTLVTLITFCILVNMTVSLFFFFSFTYSAVEGFCIELSVSGSTSLNAAPGDVKFPHY
jgi:hypothetical protein